MSDSLHPVRRSLILAGGGIKVAFQAGALQVWLDEAGMKFDHVDGASGGVFNLAMLCQGMSGKQIADNWRGMKPIEGVSPNWTHWARFAYARSLFTLDAYRRNVFPAWGMDWNRIRASTVEGTFNVYNFSKHQLEVLPPADMTEDLLCACVSLPMWFPPAVVNGQTYIDAVYITDANLEEAIRRGADEIWVIWTVSDAGVWNDGFVANYFQIIEASANGHFKRICARIEASNAAITAGKPGEFGRTITLKILKSEVPLHYLINFSADRLIEAVNVGVQQAREWCAEQAIPLRQPAAISTVQRQPAVTRLEFTEVLKGFITPGEPDYDRGFRRGRAAGTAISFELTMHINDVDRFITDPQHEAVASGCIRCDWLGGQRPVDNGAFNLLVDTENANRKAMYYRLHFRDASGNPLTLLGFKEVTDHPGADAWTDTTTLFTRILRGHVGREADRGDAIVAGGLMHIHLLDFLHQLTTFRVEGPTLAERTEALVRFNRLFLGKLWDVYASQVLSSGPI